MSQETETSDSVQESDASVQDDGKSESTEGSFDGEARNETFTGEEYLESLKDRRQVYYQGEVVEDVTTHPAFRNTARSIAQLYDALHDEDLQDDILMHSDTDENFLTHAFYRSSYSSQDLIQAKDAIAAWQRLVYGWMGRTPDYKASFMATLGGNPGFYEPYDDNARNWYRKYQRKCHFMNHAIINPPVDRDKDISEVGDVFVRVEEERDDGIVVSGAKMVGTTSALCHANFVTYYGAVEMEEEEAAKDFALTFISDMDNPDVKLISRPSYEMNTALVGSPFDYPLSQRFDENDAVLVFDEAFIPWENVFIYRDIDRQNNFFLKSGFLNRFTFHGCVRLAVKLDFVAGLLLKILESTGVKDFRGVQVNVGEVLAWRNLFWAVAEAASRAPDEGPGGTALPRNEFTAGVYRVFGPTAWSEVKRIIEDLAGGALIVQPSSARDFEDDELRRLIEKFYRGSNDYSSTEKIKLVKMMWDAMGTEFGGRHELYERNYAGNHENIRLEVLKMFEGMGKADELRGFAESAMADYDLDGWKDDTPWVNPDDVNVFQNDYLSDF